MTEDPKKRLRKAMDGLDLNLNGLLGTLGEAFNEAVSRLEQGQTGSSESTRTFETPKGPLRATSGVRVRVGGLDAGKAAAKAQPINPRRPAPAKATDTATRDLVYGLLEDQDAWILTAEMPGVALDDVVLTQDGDLITLRTKGARAYRGQIELPVNCTLDRIRTTLTNGILTMQFPKDAVE